MLGFKECCHLGQRSAEERSEALGVSCIHTFHIFKFKTPAWTPPSLKADWCCSVRWPAGRKRFWVVEERPVPAVSGRHWRSVKGEEDPDRLHFNSTLVLSAEWGFSQADPTRAEQKFVLK